MQIITLLSRRTLILIAVASVIGSMAAYFAMAAWLETFAYRISMSPGVFLISAAVAFVAGFAIIAVQAYLEELLIVMGSG